MELSLLKIALVGYLLAAGVLGLHLLVAFKFLTACTAVTASLFICAACLTGFLGASVNVHVAVVSQLAFQAVVRPHREPPQTITLGLDVVLGSLDRRALCDCLLYVH